MWILEPNTKSIEASRSKALWLHYVNKKLSQITCSKRGFACEYVIQIIVKSIKAWNFTWTWRRRCTCRYPARSFILNSDAQAKQMPIKSINTCKTKIAHWALQNIELQSHISDAYLKAKINDTTHVCSTIFSTHNNPSCEQPLIQKAVLAVHSRETRNFSQDSSRFLQYESHFSRYESCFSPYESRFLRY